MIDYEMKGRLQSHLIKLVALVATSFLSQATQAQTSKSPPGNLSSKPAQIDKNGVLIMVRGALMTLDDANKAGNYTVLRDNGSRGFQQNSDARLSEIFAPIRKSGTGLSIILIMDPQLTEAPKIEANGMMTLSGYFASTPDRINFEIIYAPEEGTWKIHGLTVSLSPASSMPATSQSK